MVTFDDEKTIPDDKIDHFIRYEEDNKEMSYFKRKLFENINCTNLICYKRKKAPCIYHKDVIYSNTKILDYCNDEKIRDYKKEGLKNYKKNKHVDNLKTVLLDTKTLKNLRKLRRLKF
jgi:hypothetical protein